MDDCSMYNLAEFSRKLENACCLEYELSSLDCLGAGILGLFKTIELVFTHEMCL